jgi:hypothetical protein
MKWVKQKTEADCVACTLAMATGLPYASFRKNLKNNSSFSVSRRRGANQDGVEQTLNFMGIEFGSTVDGDHSSVASMMNGNRGILAYKIKGGGGHAIAWDGFKVYDPCNTIKDAHEFHVYSNKVRTSIDYWMFGFTFKTPWYIRILSFAKGEIQSIEIKPQLRGWLKNVKLPRWLHLPFNRRSTPTS